MTEIGIQKNERFIYILVAIDSFIEYGWGILFKK